MCVCVCSSASVCVCVSERVRGCFFLASAGFHLTHSHNHNCRLLHRLDQNTTGVLLIGRHREATSVLSKLFERVRFRAFGPHTQQQQQQHTHTHHHGLLDAFFECGLCSASFRKRTLVLLSGTTSPAQLICPTLAHGSRHILTEVRPCTERGGGMREEEGVCVCAFISLSLGFR